MKRDNKGFTLVEVIVVVAIMGILIGLGANMFGLTKNGYVKSVAADIYDLLEKAQYNTQAVQAKSWTVSISKSGDTYQAMLIKNTADASGALFSEVQEKKEIKNDVTISLDTRYTNSFGFEKEIKAENLSSLEITFDKQTGEVHAISVDGAVYENLGEKGTITMENGAFKKSIEIYWSTGKIFN